MKPKQIGFKTHNGFVFFQSDKIIYCKAEGSYTTVVATDKTIKISKNLKEVESICATPDIIKCHKSYLVNLCFIDRISNNSTILLKNNESISISRQKVAEIVKLIVDNTN